MSKAVDHLIADWHKRDTLRVWSVIITLFGDARLRRGRAVSSQTVQAIMQRLGIESGAVRTAFSRLAKDGWVQREKQGRASFYRLAPDGITPFTKASRVIYAAPESAKANNKPSSFVVLIGDRETPDKAWLDDILQTNDTLEIRSNVYLTKTPSKAKIARVADAGFFTVTGSASHLPASLAKRIQLEELADEYCLLVSRIKPLMKNPPADGLDAMATRCLLIHSWRRLLLRTPTLARDIMPDWPQSECHTLTAGLYQRLLPASSAWLTNEATGPEGRLSRENRSVLKRFL